MAGLLKKIIKEAVLVRRVGARTQVSNARIKADNKEIKKMNEFDDIGWAHVHHAAYRGFIKSVERFVKADKSQLELETEDDMHSTPLLLAVMSGNLESVECLVKLGACVWTQNSQNHGVVELCVFKEFVSVLEYFVRLNHDRLHVWKNLVRFLGSALDEETEAAAKCLTKLTLNDTNGSAEYRNKLFDNGIIPTIVKVIKNNSGEAAAKTETLTLVLNLLETEQVREQLISVGGVPAIIKLVKSSSEQLIKLAASCLRAVCVSAKDIEHAVQNNAIPALVKAMQFAQDPFVLVEIVEALSCINDGNTANQTQTGHSQDSLSCLVRLLQNYNDKPLLVAVTKCVSALVRGHESNQNELVDEGVTAPITGLTIIKYKNLQLLAVDAIHNLAENNSRTQKIILDEGVATPLLQLLKRSRQQNIQERAAQALWALAGHDSGIRCTMAHKMGVQMLIEFIMSLSTELHYIGSEGLGVLAQGPENDQEAIARANGIHPLVRLLRSDQEEIVLSVIRTLRYLCVSVGYIPNNHNQTTIAQSRGIKFLVALSIHSRNELIRVEAAHTLGCVALGHPDNLEEIHDSIDFSYVRILKMMYADNDMVRMLAGASMAAFAYNSLQNQRAIAEQGGVRYKCFQPFLQSSDEVLRCNAAFQVVVLARIIPDEEPAISSASGIKLLVELLESSKNEYILGLAADCVARLCHTRSGIPAAFISINTVNILCKLLLSASNQVRGCAAIALGYLSYNHEGKRYLLNRCRLEPFMMKVVMSFTKKGKVSPDFIEGWKHFKQVRLPRIQEGQINLVGSQTLTQKDFSRPLSFNSGEETGASTNMQNTPTNIHVTGLQQETEYDKSNNSRCMSPPSRASNVTTLTSNISNANRRSRQGSLLSTTELQTEIVAEES